ncbi:hypothetical protein BC629DRAFT_599869 [Irpex lacteus]|nr:hypothetical protein BC629DRAFT_1583790 [Irpex lacteus]KAI0779220.1 hypothetical protein BC629DRAFT_599869 [Irpex lacteus]
MASYFRNLFGGGSSHQSGTSSSSKSHSRSKSASNIYATPSSTPSSSTRPSSKRSGSYTASHTTTPSPLRYATDTDTRTRYGYGRRGSSSSHDPELRPQVLRRATAPHHPIYSPMTGQFTPSSSRSNSKDSMFTMSSSPYGASRSDHGHYAYSPSSHGDSRPPLTSNNSWQTQTGSVGSAASSYGSAHGHSRSRSDSLPSAYVQPRATALHMHPLLAYTRLHRSPITYDVMFTPSARTVLDRATHSAIPSHTLSQPATDPPTPSSSRLILRSHKFPWPVVVTGSGPRFTIGPQKKGSKQNAITNLDVLYAVHNMLLTPVTPEEWESLGHGTRAQQKVTKAYERRCTRMGGGWEGGVRRIDWLGEKTRLVGVEVDKSAGGGGSGKLVFAKP